METCKYCNRERGHTCRNTRDMKDFAVDGNEDCLEQLALAGGGEKGLRYVILNRAETIRRREAGDAK